MKDNLEISLIGVPTNSAGKPGGVARAPSVLRKAGLVEELSKYCDVYDEGDVTFSELNAHRHEQNHIIGYESLVSMIYSVKTAVGNAFAKNRLPLVMGGDCPLLLGCLAALKDSHHSSGLFFIDGHEDAYSPIQSPTGEAADMELGFALGLNIDGLSPDLARLLPLVEKKNTCMFGIRDKTSLQSLGVKSLREEIHAYDDLFIETQDIGRIIQHEKSRIGTLVDNWWLHVDLDVLSSDSLPAVDYLQSGGISWNKLEYLTSSLLSADSCAGWNVTIYNPDLDSTLKYAKRIVNYFGNVISFVTS
ncbi:MAG: arginase family protein [Thaumarchaeota archaeon]|nr:arginase family protein [Nitrososphaerota archaeon]